MNERLGRHGQVLAERSSAGWFTGCAEPLGPADTPSPVAEPKTWLARVGWRRHGPLRFDEGPAV
jgi:putative transposase